MIHFITTVPVMKESGQRIMRSATRFFLDSDGLHDAASDLNMLLTSDAVRAHQAVPSSTALEFVFRGFFCEYSFS